MPWKTCRYENAEQKSRFVVCFQRNDRLPGECELVPFFTFELTDATELGNICEPYKFLSTVILKARLYTQNSDNRDKMSARISVEEHREQLRPGKDRDGAVRLGRYGTIGRG